MGGPAYSQTGLGRGARGGALGRSLRAGGTGRGLARVPPAGVRGQLRSAVPATLPPFRGGAARRGLGLLERTAPAASRRGQLPPTREGRRGNEGCRGHRRASPEPWPEEESAPTRKETPEPDTGSPGASAPQGSLLSWGLQTVGGARALAQHLAAGRHH